MKEKSIVITPLGGLKQIGSNMILVESFANEEPISFLIDCGILFSSDEAFEISHLFPDLNFIKNPPEFLFLTHSHEDHIGGIYHILKKFPSIKIFASPFTALSLKKKINRLHLEKNVHTFEYDQVMKVGGLIIEHIHFNHSIPETRGLIIRNDKTCILYISDFKIDFDPQFEEESDFKKIKHIVKNYPTRILMADSTNILSKNLKTPSEASLVPSLTSRISNHEGRIYITFFASNLFRFKNILLIAKTLNKKVYLHGQSMVSSFQHGLDTKIFGEESSVILNPTGDEHVHINNDENCIILLAGCQADLKSSFRRVAYGEDKKFVPKPGDLFIMSSRSIPGNEKKITNSLNEICERGAQVVLPEMEHTHVSGHAGKEDLKILFDQFDPTDFVPIHGESLFLDLHCEYVKNLKPHINIHCIKNYDSLEIGPKKITAQKTEFPIAPIMFHGNNIPLEKEKLNERKKVARSGLVIVTINCKVFTGNVDPHKIKTPGLFIKTVGICDSGTAQQEKLLKILNAELPYILNSHFTEENEEKLIKTSVRKHFNQFVGQKPVVIVQFL